MPDMLVELEAIIQDRKVHPQPDSYTCKLFDQGVNKIAQKVGEEAVETLIEGVRGDKVRLAEESADLLYHLLVLWADQDVKPAAIWEALARRRETSAMVQNSGQD